MHDSMGLSRLAKALRISVVEGESAVARLVGMVSTRNSGVAGAIDASTMYVAVSTRRYELVCTVTKCYVKDEDSL